MAGNTIKAWWDAEENSRTAAKSAATVKLELAIQVYDQELQDQLENESERLFEKNIEGDTPTPMEMVLEFAKNKQTTDEDKRTFASKIYELTRNNNSAKLDSQEKLFKSTHKLWSEVNKWLNKHETTKSCRRRQVLNLRDELTAQLQSITREIERLKPVSHPRTVSEPTPVCSARLKPQLPRTASEPTLSTTSRYHKSWLRDSFRFFARRTADTKKLDKAVEAFNSNKCQTQDSCQKLLDAIEEWKDQRENSSSRAATVERLEQEVVQLQRDMPVTSKFGVAKYGVLPLIAYFVQYIMTDFSALVDAVQGTI